MTGVQTCALPICDVVTHFVIQLCCSQNSHFYSNLVTYGFSCRFVNKKEEVLERLLGVKHVFDTRSASLKSSLDAMFKKHNLTMCRLRGQGYDGASNMRGELHGLKTLVLADNPHAFYVHCFAHQLQLVVVAVVKGVLVVGDFFGHLNKIVNMVSPFRLLQIHLFNSMSLHICCLISKCTFL